jgi:hypothetical protein
MWQLYLHLSGDRVCTRHAATINATVLRTVILLADVKASGCRNVRAWRRKTASLAAKDDHWQKTRG